MSSKKKPLKKVVKKTKTAKKTAASKKVVGKAKLTPVESMVLSCFSNSTLIDYMSSALKMDIDWAKIDLEQENKFAKQLKVKPDMVLIKTLSKKIDKRQKIINLLVEAKKIFTDKEAFSKFEQ